MFNIYCLFSPLPARQNSIDRIIVFITLSISFGYIKVLFLKMYLTTYHIPVPSFSLIPCLCQAFKSLISNYIKKWEKSFNQNENNDSYYLSYRKLIASPHIHSLANLILLFLVVGIEIYVSEFDKWFEFGGERRNW